MRTFVEQSPYVLDDTKIITSTSLKLMRHLLGMQPAECALALGGAVVGDVVVLERTNTYFVYSGHASMLSRMLERVEILIEEELEGSEPDFLITYDKDPDFVQFDYHLQSWMLFASVHRMFTARLWREWIARGHTPIIVGLRVPDYLDFLQDGDGPETRREDTDEERMAWAAEYVQRTGRRESLPTTINDGWAEEQMEKRAEFKSRKKAIGELKDATRNMLRVLIGTREWLRSAGHASSQRLDDLDAAVEEAQRAGISPPDNPRYLESDS
jgi:hypothetical protein